MHLTVLVFFLSGFYEPGQTGQSDQKTGELTTTGPRLRIRINQPDLAQTSVLFIENMAASFTYCHYH